MTKTGTDETPEAFADREHLQFDKVGRCVNGVAHDVNNCLGAILAYAELCGMDATLSPESQRMVGRIIESVERASALVTELTNIARPLKRSQGMIDLRQLVRGLALLREYDLRIRQITLVQEFPQEVPSLSGDASQIRLALLYILASCEEAVTTTEQRRIEATLQVEQQGLVLNLRTPVTVPTAGVLIRTEGLPADNTLEKGLEAASQIIQQHGGRLSYTTDKGFQVFLPYLTTP